MQKGFDIRKIAETFNTLMCALGYERYVAQGGDWGSSISRVLGVVYPANCRGVHVNLQKGAEPPKWYRNPLVWVKMHSQLVHYSREEEAMMARSRWFDKGETGYRVRSYRFACIACFIWAFFGRYWGSGEGLICRIFRRLNLRVWLTVFGIHLLAV
jgi:pimeloyl-ACP methyl ester carboxylesterase